jgi:hypothetical protein
MKGYNMHRHCVAKTQVLTVVLSTLATALALSCSVNGQENNASDQWMLWSFNSLKNESDLVIIGAIADVEFRRLNAEFPEHRADFIVKIQPLCIFKNSLPEVPASNLELEITSESVEQQSREKTFTLANGPREVNWGEDGIRFRESKSNNSESLKTKRAYIFYLKKAGGEHRFRLTSSGTADEDARSVFTITGSTIESTLSLSGHDGRTKR